MFDNLPRKRCPYDNILVIPVLAVFLLFFYRMVYRGMFCRGTAPEIRQPRIRSGSPMPDLRFRCHAVPFFLFLGGFVLSSLLEYSTGMFFEKVYKKKLWDYSRFRYNVGGYICLPFSLLWGALSVVTVMFADPLLCGPFDRIPHLLSVILLLVL